jgi:hypothetical protein
MLKRTRVTYRLSHRIKICLAVLNRSAHELLL